VIRGKRVVSALDVNDLEPGKKHLCIFKVWRCLSGSTGTCR
jgi:hypothetical protein